MRRFGEVAFENVVCAAIGADDFAGVGDVEKNARVARPQRRVGAWAVQRQVVCRDFDGRSGGFFGHGFALCNNGGRGAEESFRHRFQT